jgi:ribulose bisphosphate carboxylase small subunit
MIKLRVTKASGEISEYDITPALEYAFEQNFKTGFHKRFRDEERQSDVYWLSWEAERRAEVTVAPFGEKYLQTLSKVEILDADSPNG